MALTRADDIFSEELAILKRIGYLPESVDAA